MFYVKSETFFSSFFVAETLHTKPMQALSHTITKSYIIICMYIENRLLKKKKSIKNASKNEYDIHPPAHSPHSPDKFVNTA